MSREDLIAPYLTGLANTVGNRWEGQARPRPWERSITATFAHLETPELVPVVADLLRLQTVEPHVIVVDTGSSAATIELLEEQRRPELEISYVRSHSYRHPSGPVSAACDLAMSLCLSEYLFMTHADAFLMRRDVLAELMALCDAEHPVVGYRMSDRSMLKTEDWRWMVSHTCTLLHMPTVRRAGAWWAIEAAHDAYGQPRSPVSGGWPDTETGFNLALRAAGIEPIFIGDETNYERHTDGRIDHARSYPGSALYAAGYHAKAQRWIDRAVEEARERIAVWQAERDAEPKRRRRR